MDKNGGEYLVEDFDLVSPSQSQFPAPEISPTARVATCPKNSQFWPRLIQSDWWLLDGIESVGWPNWFFVWSWIIVCWATKMHIRTSNLIGLAILYLMNHYELSQFVAQKKLKVTSQLAQHDLWKQLRHLPCQPRASRATCHTESTPVWSLPGKWLQNGMLCSLKKWSLLYHLYYIHQCLSICTVHIVSNNMYTYYINLQDV